MSVRVMSVEDLQLILGWAAKEGWNPGLDDAAAFHAADANGFLLKEVHGKPVAAVSVVNHDSNFAFLGLYLCKPAFRGQGYGMEVWHAGIAHAGTRCIGLDGVPDQQANYARSGFAKFGSTVRYEGRMDTVPDPRIDLATQSELPRLLTRDLRASGMNRSAFTRAWLSQSTTRKTVVLTVGSDIKGFATFRQCAIGIKVGPLHASCEADALALLASNPFTSNANPLFVDVPGHTSRLALLLKSRRFEPVFETARMFTKKPPECETPSFQAIASMELG